MNAPGFRVRFAGFLALVAGVAALAIFSCSSDPTNTLGSDSDLLGSKPGEVIQDTLEVFDDTTYAFNSPIAVAEELELGMDSLYTRAIIIQPTFNGLTTGFLRLLSRKVFRFVSTNTTSPTSREMTSILTASAPPSTIPTRTRSIASSNSRMRAMPWIRRS